MFKWTVHSAKQLTGLDFIFIGVIAHSVVASALIRDDRIYLYLLKYFNMSKN